MGAPLPRLATLADADECRMPDASAEPQAGASLERPADRRTARRSLSRWAVHLGLLLSAAASSARFSYCMCGSPYHTVVGLVFVGLVVVHLVQRRRTVARMATQLVRTRTFIERRIRLAVSDLVLVFITLNVLVSGILDWSRGAPLQIPLPSPFVPMAPRLRDRPRHLPGSACLASAETLPTFDDPIVGKAGMAGRDIVGKRYTWPISTCDVSLILLGKTLPVPR